MRYFLVTFYRQPGGQINEEVRAAKRVKTSDYSTCNIIVDYGTKQVLKSVIEGKKHETDYIRLTDYYKKVYPKLIEQLEKEGPTELKQTDNKITAKK